MTKDTVSVRGEPRQQAEFDADIEAQRVVEAATAGLDDQIALSFAELSLEKDGGLSAEVVRTLKQPGPATGFAEKA